MNQQKRNGIIIPYSKLRRELEMMYHSVQRKPMIHGLFAVDVTKARTYVREHKAKTGEALSFTAFIVVCLAHALESNPAMQACRKGSRHLIIFDAVDVAIPIEREIAGKKQPMAYIVRDAQRKTYHEIHSELRRAQQPRPETVWEGFIKYWLRVLPLVFLRIGWWVFCWMRQTYPQVQKRYGGTVGVTAIGMCGKTAGWGIPLNDHSLDLTVGGIAEKPGIVDGHIAIREYLSLTLSVNHALIDGAPAARFAQRLHDIIESGYGLGS